MSRRFYLPLHRKAPPPKHESVLWQRLRLALSAVGVVVVVLLVWWYFANYEQLHSASHHRESLGSSAEDSLSQSSPVAKADSSRRVPTSVSTGESSAAATDSLEVRPLHAADDRRVKLELQNGCHKGGLATKVATALQSRSRFFDILEKRNSSRSDTAKFSSVVGRTADSSLALAVADSLGIERSRVSFDIPKSPRDVEVTVILGMDYLQLRLNLKSDTKE